MAQSAYDISEELKQTYKEDKETWDTYSITDLVKAMQRTKAHLDETKKQAAQLQKDWDLLRKIIIPNKLEELGLDSVKVKGIGTVSERHDAYCNVVSGAKEQLLTWLREEGYEDIIKEDVNSSSLKAQIKEIFEEGGEIPDAYVNFVPYTYVAITKS